MHYGDSGTFHAADSRVELERLRQELATARREAARVTEAYELEKGRWEAEGNSLRATIASLQSSVDSVSGQRNRDSRERSEMSRQLDDLRADNAKLRRELAAALDTRLSHLRTPQVSFEQYRELLQLCERYSTALSGTGAAAAGGPDAAAAAMSQSLAQARQWADRMESAPFVSNSASSASASAAAVAVAQTPQQLQQPLDALLGPGVTPRGILPTPAVTPAPSMDPRRSASMQTPLSSGGPTSLTQAAPNLPPSTSLRADTGTAVKESVVEGGRLVKIIRDHPPSGKQWSFHNTTTDTQFLLEFTFGPLSDIEAMGDTQREGRTLRVNLYPGETKPFVKGTINGYKMSIRYGPPDEGFVPPTSVTDVTILPALDRVKNILAHSHGNALEAAAACRAEGIPFIDTEFAPLSSAMARGFEGLGPAVQWLQPQDFLPDGQREELCSTGVGPLAPIDGQCEDAWLTSAMAVLAEDPAAVVRIFSRTSPADMANHIYSVWVNRTGLWRCVTLDAFFPCTLDNKQYGAQCRTQRDLWVSLLEKAFAKSHGSYASLAHGDTLEALQDITGFPTERFDWKERETTLFSALHKAVALRTNIVVLLTGSSRDGEAAAKKSQQIGLRPDRGYRLLATVVVEGFRLCLIRNTSGSTRDWAGAWSERSDLWSRHPKAREACEAAAGTLDLSSTMWIEWRDVVHYFDGAGCCFARPNWTDLRIPARFFGSRPSCVLEISVTRPSRMFIGIHQRDKRGLEQTDPDRVYSAFLLTIVGCSQNGVWDAIAQSHNGTFWRGRDTSLLVALEPNDRAYYVIPRRYSADGVKEVVLSLLIESPEGVSVELKQPTEEVLAAVRYSPVWKFDPLGCQPLGSVEVQVNKESSSSLRW